MKTLRKALTLGLFVALVGVSHSSWATESQTAEQGQGSAVKISKKEIKKSCRSEGHKGKAFKTCVANKQKPIAQY